MSDPTQFNRFRSQFNELVVVDVKPELQIDAVYGLRSKTDTKVTTGSGGTADVEETSTDGQLFRVQTGTTTGGNAKILSKRGVRYRPGQEIRMRYTAIFDANPVANSVQRAGGFNEGNEVAFGYNGTTFGVFRRRGGKPEIYTFEITGESNGYDHRYDGISHLGGIVPYIIAEIGSNWRDSDTAEKQIIRAKKAGANAVKFQYYKSKDLYGHSVSGLPAQPLLLELQHFARIARQQKIDFLCTAFSKEGYRKITPLVEFHKVASCEATDLDMIDHVFELNKNVMISTGGLNHDQIALLMSRYPKDRLIITECVLNYPAEPHEYNITCLRDWTDNGYTVAFSDHTKGYQTALAAQAMGCNIFEKHVDLVDVPHETPDSCVSANYLEFYDYCQALNGQSIKYRMSDVEQNNAGAWQRRATSEGFYRPCPQN